jgi:CO/xanthine dehydrogenase FAD-binding subunit
MLVPIIRVRTIWTLGMGSYLRPSTLDDALAALAIGGRTILAGGTDHFPARVPSAPDEDIVDISALPGLRTVRTWPDHVRIPCLATWSDLIAAPLPALCDGLIAAARQVGGVQIQNAGTIVGNICNASPAADGVPCLLALNAEVELASVRGRRMVSLDHFILGPRRIARAANELVLGLRIPIADCATRSVFEKLGARRYQVISIVMVAAVAEFAADLRTIARARIAVGACGPRSIRLPALECALAGRRPDPHIIDAAHLAPIAPIGDIRGTAAYRRAAALELVRRAVAALAEPRAGAA